MTSGDLHLFAASTGADVNRVLHSGFAAVKDDKVYGWPFGAFLFGAFLEDQK
jgi:hypothetical protein